MSFINESVFTDFFSFLIYIQNMVLYANLEIVRRHIIFMRRKNNFGVMFAYKMTQNETIVACEKHKLLIRNHFVYRNWNDIIFDVPRANNI